MFLSSKLVDAAVRNLREAIGQGRWRSGEMLPGQRELAEQMGISRPSLREALTVLETLGMIRVLPGRGVMVLERASTAEVAAVPVQDRVRMEDVFQSRYALEPFIVGLVAQNIAPNDVSRLRLNLADMSEAIEDGDIDAAVDAHIAFHSMLVSFTSNPIFVAVTAQIHDALSKSAPMMRARSESLAEPLREHEAIVRAIRQRDSSKASQLMRRHIVNESERLGVHLSVPEDEDVLEG
ncbi:MAG: FadR/GntR family transcriptional regulator [Pseudomonas sp.]